MTMARCWASRVLLWLAAAILSSGCGSDRAGDSNGQLSRGDSSTTTAGGSKVQLSQDEKALLDRLLLPGLDVRMTQGAVNLFLDVKPDDAAALVAVLRVIGG
jgi:hypothetical protein